MHTNSKLRKLSLVSSIALAMVAIGGPVAAGAPSQDVLEARQESQIWTTYALSPYLRANDIKVSVDDGTATLTGMVEEDVNKDLAKQIALGVDGIKEVDNQIAVKSDYVTPARGAKRGYGDMVDDETITAAVKSKLHWSKNAHGMDTAVSTDWGKVTLTGTADSAETKDLATRLALNTRGVVAVDNRLVIVNTTPQITKQDMADSWITTKVKSTYMYSTNVNNSDITVSTSKGVVTLSGELDSGAERALAIEFAENVKGVKRVDSKALTLAAID